VVIGVALATLLACGAERRVLHERDVQEELRARAAACNPTDPVVTLQELVARTGPGPQQGTPPRAPPPAPPPRATSSPVATATTPTHLHAGGSGRTVYATGNIELSAAGFSMTSSNVDSNTASILGGGFYLTGAASLTCTGSSSATYGIWGNTALAAGGVYLGSTSASLTSTTCDWTASSDNTLYDIVTSLFLYYAKGDDATFSCSGGSC
jgi:hypothetical protein